MVSYLGYLASLLSNVRKCSEVYQSFEDPHPLDARSVKAVRLSQTVKLWNMKPKQSAERCSNTLGYSPRDL